MLVPVRDAIGILLPFISLEVMGQSAMLAVVPSKNSVDHKMQFIIILKPAQPSESKRFAQARCGWSNIYFLFGNF